MPVILGEKGICLFLSLWSRGVKALGSSGFKRAYMLFYLQHPILLRRWPFENKNTLKKKNSLKTRCCWHACAFDNGVTAASVAIWRSTSVSVRHRAGRGSLSLRLWRIISGSVANSDLVDIDMTRLPSPLEKLSTDNDRTIINDKHAAGKRRRCIPAGVAAEEKAEEEEGSINKIW